MSKINSMLLLFDKNKKVETDKKEKLNIEKAKSSPINPTIQKQDSSQTKNNFPNNNQNPISHNIKKNNNSLADRMKMFEKNNKIPEKTEKKIRK